MKSIIIFLLILFFIDARGAFAQAFFSKELSGSNSFCSIVGLDSSSNVIKLDGSFIRLDKYGSVIPGSYKCISTSGELLRIFDVLSLKDSCFLLSGYVWDLALSQKACLAKTNANGEILWVRYSDNILANAFPYSSIQTIDGNFIYATTTSDSINPYNFIFIQKSDTAGNILWSQRLTTQGSLTICKIFPTRDNGFVMVGQKGSISFIAKLEQSGAITWAKTLSVPNSSARQIKVLSDKNYLVAGSVGTNFYLTKLDSLGNLIWYKSYQHSGFTDVQGFIERSNGDLCIVGGIESLKFGLLLITDTLGNYKYAKSYFTDSIPSYAYLTNVFESKDKSLSLFARGQTGSNFIMKVDSVGYGICFTSPDSFQVGSSNCTINNDTLVSLPNLGLTNQLIFSNSLSPVNVSDFCLNNFVANTQVKHLSIYPNPVIDRFTITFPEYFLNGTLEIFNPLGESVVIKKLTLEDQNTEINLPSLIPLGVYYGRLCSKSEVLEFRFVKGF